MAYRFDGTIGAQIIFTAAPFIGLSFNACTFAYLFKRISYPSSHVPLALTGSGGSGVRARTDWGSATSPRLLSGGGGNVASVDNAAYNDTANWLLLAITWTGATSSAAAIRFHRNKGSGWTHTASDAGSDAASASIITGDEIRINGGSFNADMVCAGIKRASSTDLAIETLSLTSFQAWRDFNFDWLIGMQTLSALQDQASPGTGDETSRVGAAPTLVSDPPSWVWTPPALTPVANFTGTPLSGAIPLSVTFTDSSTNTPTSWAWDFGDGSTSTSQNPTHSYAAGGTYTVALTATNASGSDTKTRTGYLTASEAIAYATAGGIEIY